VVEDEDIIPLNSQHDEYQKILSDFNAVMTEAIYSLISSYYTSLNKLRRVYKPDNLPKSLVNSENGMSLMLSKSRFISDSNYMDMTTKIEINHH